MITIPLDGDQLGEAEKRYNKLGVLTDEELLSLIAFYWHMIQYFNRGLHQVQAQFFVIMYTDKMNMAIARGLLKSEDLWKRP